MTMQQTPRTECARRSRSREYGLFCGPTWYLRNDKDSVDPRVTWADRDAQSRRTRLESPARAKRCIHRAGVAVSN
jgi:hypothetical protein